jgi:DNA-binding CsgD family transcriptional regulator
MSSESDKQELIGRVEECAELDGLISDVRSGNSRVLVIRGEAGVGKTALLQHVSASATGFRCIQVSGVQAEMELAYAGLQQLCAPMMDRADTLPLPQLEALTVAFGQGSGPAPDRFLVGLAVLSLMAAVADHGPLLCVIDDAQWLDQVSVQLLGFVARRLLAEPVALVCAARTGDDPVLTGLPELSVAGLSDADARTLLGSVVLGRIDERVRDRIVAETRGIPLALLEVPRNVSASTLTGGFGEVGRRPSAGGIEDGFLRRIQRLPGATRQLLLVAAADPVGDVALFLRAAEQLGIPVETLVPAQDAGLVELDNRVRFSHPLMRSAAYRAADHSSRRAAHRALAAATDPQSDPDRRAWHAANAAAGPDDAVAADLERSAHRAQSRGGIAAAASFLERAAALTSQPAIRSARALAAAQAKRDATAPESSHELLAIAELGPLSELQRAQVAHLRAQMNFARNRGGSGGDQLAASAAQLFAAARQLEHLDHELCHDAYLQALVAAMYTGRLGESRSLSTVARAARAALCRSSKARRPADLLLTGWAERISGGAPVGGGTLRSALEMMRDTARRDDGQALTWMPLGLANVLESAAAELWDDALHHQLAVDLVRQTRAAGALAVLPPALVYRAGVHVQAGQFNAAEVAIEEANSIAAATGYTPLKYHSLSLAAWRGNPVEATRLIEAAAAAGAAKGEGRVLAATGCHAAILYNGLGRYEDALIAAREACGHEDRGLFGWSLIELIEAAARTDQRREAVDALKLLAERAGASGTDWGAGMLARSQALLSDTDSAEELFIEAISRLERTRIVVHLARSRLIYGEWLRRTNRRADARRQLSQAHRMFTGMGAQAFAERARRELLATGDKVRRQPAATGGSLTAQESQIARLAGEGLTNQEIGAQLFISTHTVEWHLRKVFVKLDITSRRQLRNAPKAG